MIDVTYKAVLEPSSTGGYSVYFPDISGCTSYGLTVDEAQRNAKEALAMHLRGMKEDGEEFPIPSEKPNIISGTSTGYIIVDIKTFVFE